MCIFLYYEGDKVGEADIDLDLMEYNRKVCGWLQMHELPISEAVLKAEVYVEIELEKVQKENASKTTSEY